MTTTKTPARGWTTFTIDTDNNITAFDAAARVPDLVGALLPSGLRLRAEARGGPDADLAAGGEVGAVPPAAVVFAGEADFGQRAADLHDVSRSDVYVLLLHGQYSSPLASTALRSPRLARM